MSDNCHVRFNSNINVDLIKISSNTALTIDDAMKSKKQQDAYTILFSDFTNNKINAEYLSPDEVVTGSGFSIYKKTPDQKYYNYVCKLDGGNYQVYDYNIRNDQYYHYLVSVELPTGNGGYEYRIYENVIKEEEKPEYPEYYKIKFDEWFICNIEETDTEGVYKKTGDAWTLGLNFEDETITRGLSLTSWDTLGKYNRVSIGAKQCESGSFSGLLGLMKEYTQYKYTKEGSETKQVYQYTEKMEHYDNGTHKWMINGPNYEYSTEMDKLNAWKAFCSDGELKLLRDIKGNAWIIQIIDQPTYNIDNKSNLKQTKISFSWQEVEDIDACSIVVVGSAEK